MNDFEPIKLASLLFAAACQLLSTYDEKLVLWAGEAKYEQRCCLCGYWITLGTSVRQICNVTRSRECGEPVGDYAHAECPELPA